MAGVFGFSDNLRRHQVVRVVDAAFGLGEQVAVHPRRVVGVNDLRYHAQRRQQGIQIIVFLHTLLCQQSAFFLKPFLRLVGLIQCRGLVGQRSDDRLAAGCIPFASC